MTVSRHYQKERFLRENIIKLIGGEGVIIKTVIIEKYKEVFITDNCVAIFHDVINDVLITKYIMSESQLKRMYADAPEELIIKARKYQKMGCGRF